jgi:hypothetical protein
MDSVNGGTRKKIMEEVLREENLVLLPKDFVRVQHDKREAHGRRRKTKYSIVQSRGRLCCSEFSLPVGFGGSFGISETWIYTD